MTEPKKNAPTKKELDLLNAESRFVSETGLGIEIDNSEAEGEPFDFGVDGDDDDGQAAA